MQKYDGHIADKLLNAMDKHFPGIREICRAHLRAINKSDVSTHNTEGRKCLIDSTTIHDHIYRQMQVDGFRKENEMAVKRYGKLSSQFCAITNWRYTRSIYRFDETLYQTLVEQPLDILPMELLVSLPERSVYIETPENPYTGTGFFAYFDCFDEAYSLVLLFIPKNQSELRIPIEPGLSLQGAVSSILKKVSVHYGVAEKQHFETRYRMALNLLLYLCCDNVDYSGQRKPQRHNWKEKKTSVYRKIGFTIGEKLREAEGSVRERHGMKPHVRSAHWHTYWKGKHGEQAKVLHWIEPIFVNLQGETI